MLVRIAIGCAFLSLAALGASAADVYVDVANGNDADTGSSPATAWRTLSHASQTAPSGSSTNIHVAPGTYSPATGGTLLHTSVAPFPPIAFQRPIPNSVVLIGHTFSFQALTSSSLAPQGFAYTDAASVTIVP